MIPTWLKELFGLESPADESLDTVLDETVSVLHRARLEIGRLHKEEHELEESRRDVQGRLGRLLGGGQEWNEARAGMASISRRLDEIREVRVSLQQDVRTLEHFVQRERSRWSATQVQSSLLETRKRMALAFGEAEGEGNDEASSADERLQDFRRGMFLLRNSLDELLRVTSHASLEVPGSEVPREPRIRKLSPDQEESTACDCCARPGTVDIILLVGDQHLCAACIQRASDLARESENDSGGP